MDVWTEMKAYVGLCADDTVRLRALQPEVEPHLGRIVDHFYEVIDRFDGARNVFDDLEQVERLKKTMQAWIQQLLMGPYDEVYYQRRQRIGRVHVRVGLPQQYVFTAMNLLRSDLCEIAMASLGPAESHQTCLSLGRITDLELAVMSGTYMEVREQEKLRSLQDLIVQNMPVMVLCLDAEGRVTSATRPEPDLLTASHHIGDHYTVYLSTELLEAADFTTRVAAVLVGQEELMVPDVVLGEGREARHFRLTLVPLEHRSARILIHLEELTDVVTAQARAQQAESLARLGSLAANVAHEVRNPLSAISATLQVIGNSLPVDDRRRRIIGKVNEQVFRLDRLVTDLLGYARPAEARIRELPLAGIAREAAEQSGVEPEVVILGEAHARIDAQYVRQILINLLQNARDAVGVGGHIQLRVGPGPRLMVIDDGGGIPDEVAGGLFEPFVTSKTRGTGLGLAISRKLAESMDGSLDLSTTADAGLSGACFVLRLVPVS
ncbi:MAG: signal transduction histidine kinase [Myxococcota bacterium]